MTDSDQQISAVERQTLSILDSLKTALSENSRVLIVGGGLVLVLNWAGIISLGLPSWWPIAVVVVGAGGIAGWMASDRLYSLIPEDEKIVLVSFHTTDGTGGEIWSLHSDEFEELEVERGDLYQWDASPTRCYEVREYDPQTNTAIGNWRESKPASALAEQEEIDDVLADIEELRELLEPEVRRARKLRRQLPGIVRVLDAQRDAEVNEGLEQATVDADIDDATVSRVLEDVLDDEIAPHPDAGGDAEGDKSNGHRDGQDIEIAQSEYDAILDSPDEGDGPKLGGL